jgi:3-oxoacyl-[acyl-carrier protein] reductase
MTGTSLAGKVALVTGAGGGIGRATALELAGRGAKVAVHYRRNRSGAHEAVSAIQAQGGSAESFEADVTSEEAVRAMVRGVESRFGRVDILINNAGDLVGRHRVSEMTAAIFNQILQVNVTSTWLCVRAVLDMMVARGAGSIVNMASLAAHTGGGPGAFAYAAAKAAVIGMTHGMARELAPLGIRVNCVAPGLIGGTDFHQRFTAPDAFASAEKAVLLGRAGRPEEVARVIAFLAADDSSYLVGETIEINGGVLMR